MNTTESDKERIASNIEIECKRLRNLEYNVVLSYKNKKRPIGKTWTDSAKMECNGYIHNIGLICSNKMLVIDIDKSGEDDEIADIIYMAMLRNFPETAGSVTKTPTGGYHLYLHTDKVIQSVNKTRDWKFYYDGKCYRVPIDIKSEGGFVVIAPSTYPYDEETTPEHNKWKSKFKGIPYQTISPIGEKTKTASDNLIKFIEQRDVFYIDEYYYISNEGPEEEDVSTDSDW